MQLRVLTWNVRGFRAGVRRASEVLGDIEPDVALLQEVGRTGYRLLRVASRTGMQAASGLRFWRRGIANAVLVRPPWRLAAEGLVPLPRAGGSHRRGLVTAVVGREGYRVSTVSVHLGLHDAERRAHAEDLSRRVPAFRQPVVVGGDLNEGPEAAAASWLAERMWDAFAVAGEGPGETYPAGDPSSRIDYLFTTEGIDVARAWVAEADGSDHLPVAADLALLPPDDD